MPARNLDLHGSAPDKSDTALLLIDVINDLAFSGGKRLFQHALPAAKRIAALKKRARAAGIPSIYVNDNFGKWQSDFRRQVAHCLAPECIGRPIAQLLEPDDEDYFVLKPKHSGFFSTSLDILLHYLGASTLILTGFAGNICVLYTANDAYMRDFHLIVPSDCIASEASRTNEYALQQMKQYLRADTRPSSKLHFKSRAAPPSYP